MSLSHRLTPSTPGAWRRALIVTLYLGIAVAGIAWQAVQNRPDTVYVYVQNDVAYAQAASETDPHPLFPLPAECRLRWTNGVVVDGASADEMPFLLDTGTDLLPQSRVALSMQTIGDVSVQPGSPWVTIHSKAGDVQVMADCPAPAPTTHHIYIYVEGQHLFLYDTLDGRRQLLMPLVDQLLWSGDESANFVLQALVVRPEDRMGYAWLPEGAVVLGDFETGFDLDIHNLDDMEIQIRYGTHELNLVSYNG